MYEVIFNWGFYGQYPGKKSSRCGGRTRHARWPIWGRWSVRFLAWRWACPCCAARRGGAEHRIGQAIAVGELLSTRKRSAGRRTCLELTSRRRTGRRVRSVRVLPSDVPLRVAVGLRVFVLLVAGGPRLRAYPARSSSRTSGSIRRRFAIEALPIDSSGANSACLSSPSSRCDRRAHRRHVGVSPHAPGRRQLTSLPRAPGAGRPVINR